MKTYVLYTVKKQKYVVTENLVYSLSLYLSSGSLNRLLSYMLLHRWSCLVSLRIDDFYIKY